ncbi:TPA: hypothetical protein ACNV18_000079 [Pseudomonas putida]|uniref:hypothetical protein n=1 Tax=Pseudomonas TaxID=286 RepID=UPI00035F926B|nr:MULTISPECIES: hypothetical protein [Pseudomonas]ANC84187.1 hypothetical protein KKK_25550 [Pseudomonas putida B6-2]MBA6113839.1 hypothetical protein [Pseudomonas asiatica]MCZ9640482.1 hypothetical protein [Pseudomonas putida]MCZ9640950.1 hypothetical protein [Pseudomonas putida]
MNDSHAIELYAHYVSHYKQKSPLVIVQPPILSDGRTMTGRMIPFMESTADFLRELSNSINDFRRWINTLEAWQRVYDASGDEDRLYILFEHIRPFATLALSGPQAIRGRIMHAAATSCGHANFVLHGHNSALQWNGAGHLNMKIAAKIGQPWDSWKALAELLSQKLGYGPIHDLTDDFRNQHEHGHPRNIGLGLTASVRVAEGDGGQRSWSIGAREAISIDVVVDETSAQHALAVEAYDSLCALAREQFEELFVATGTLLPS